MQSFASLSQVVADLEKEKAYHRHNEERWNEGLRNGGRVNGVQGKQTKQTCLISMTTHKAAGDTITKIIEMISCINPEFAMKMYPDMASGWIELDIPEAQRLLDVAHEHGISGHIGS